MTDERSYFYPSWKSIFSKIIIGKKNGHFSRDLTLGICSCCWMMSFEQAHKVLFEQKELRSIRFKASWQWMFSILGLFCIKYQVSE